MINNNEILDERIRELEKTTSTIDGKVSNISQDITEMKQMFNTFMVNATKIAEHSAKLEQFEEIKRNQAELKEKFMEYQIIFYKLQAEHGVCINSKGKYETILEELKEKMIPMESALKDLTDKSRRAEGTLWRWVERGAMIIVQAILLVTIFHYQEIASNLAQNSLPQVKQTQQDISKEKMHSDLSNIVEDYIERQN